MSELNGFVFNDFANFASVRAVHLVIICMIFVKKNIA